MTFEAITQLTPGQIDDLWQLYQQEWWAQHRKKVEIEKMLENSDEIVAFCDPESKRLVAFTRILTDYVYRALILDVIVQESYQGRGLGRGLMEAILAHPPLQSVELFLLGCLPDMVPFYQKWGFTGTVAATGEQLNLLILDRHHVLQSPS